MINVPEFFKLSKIHIFIHTFPGTLSVTCRVQTLLERSFMSNRSFYQPTMKGGEKRGGSYYKQKYGGGNRRSWSTTTDRQPESVNLQDDNMLRRLLISLNWKPYQAYKSLTRYVFSFPLYSLKFAHVQSDPHAPPSIIRVCIPASVAQLQPHWYSSQTRKIALADYLIRHLIHEMNDTSVDLSKADRFSISSVSQKVLERSSMMVHEGALEVRLRVPLPAQGRSIMAHKCIEMLLKDLPQLVERFLQASVRTDQRHLEEFIQCIEDQQWLRAQLWDHDLVAFVPNGAVLPRVSGVSELPLTSNSVPFKAPTSMEVSFSCPSGKTIVGMGIKRGVTMIAGGGYHGKSTLLQALQQGIYDHIPGDGREYVVADPTLVKIRTEDGRSVEGTDISPYINNLPFNASTKKFCTTHASGSTSMAASIQEMLEMQVTAFAFDEDTSATNFLIRDRRMQLIVAKDREPITPLIYKIRTLFREKGVSSILVIGGCGDYVDVADTIIEMYNYKPRDITDFAKQIAQQYPSNLSEEGGSSYGTVSHRCLELPDYLSRRIRVRNNYIIGFEKAYDLCLQDLEQLAEQGQVLLIADILAWLYHQEKIQPLKVRDMVTQVENIMDKAYSKDNNDHLLSSMDEFVSSTFYVHGDYTRPTAYQIAQVINRLRESKLLETAIL
ncbi:uncharacterized protein BYT42DRAFT_601143 [Radiomyces spectabilis]|uniref:uncharacterized protein n=1 Tax=Radiomyces spectabilis TaxID=64574 RepID=UPI00221EB8E2|nr:uncharacterized protein BYT42DRAFT_601143 [Radiomyces spectabilis]KAI8393481.1 hypothetical protein BYT42DRAFT_601143 [Radiomyces spectabilis]